MSISLKPERFGMQQIRSAIARRRGTPASPKPPPCTILMADDDPDDCDVVKEALNVAGLTGHLRFVSDGVELMDYLEGRGRFAEQAVARPCLILLDLNMPRKDGRETLREIKAHPDLKTIPVAVFTTSSDMEDIDFCRRSGADLFFTKPNSFESMVEMMAAIGKQWLGA